MSARSDFWARRKAAVAAEAEAESRAVAQAEAAAEQASLEDRTEAEILEELNLPDPDTLEQGDDFSAFLAKAVPERIRRRALRKLWLSNPILANVDELVDYGEDFTDKAMVVEGMQTAYQVGKGMLKHLTHEDTDQDRDHDEGQNPDQPEVETAASSEGGSEGDAPDMPLEHIAPATASRALVAPPTKDDTPAQPRRRRLRFEFAGKPGATPTMTEAG